MADQLTLDISAIERIGASLQLTPREMDRALDAGLRRGRVVAYRAAIQLLARNAEGFSGQQVRFRRRVFTEFDRVNRSVQVWEGLEPLEPDRLSIEDYRESRRLERDEGLGRREARYRFRTPIEVAAVQQEQGERVIEPVQAVALAEFEKSAKQILEKAAAR